MWFILEFILLKRKRRSQCKWTEKRMEYCLQYMEYALDIAKERSWSSFSGLEVCREKPSWRTLFIHSVCSSWLWKMCILVKRKGRMFWAGRVGRRKFWRLSDDYFELESLAVQIGRLQLCWNTLVGNLYPCVIFLIVFEIKFKEEWKCTWM